MSVLTRNRILAASLVLATTIAVAGCSSDSSQPGGQKELDLEIGNLVPLSGVEEPFGATGQKATDLAVTEIRNAIKETKSDHTVSIDHQNYRSEPKLAQDLASRLIRGGKSCLVGPWSTSSMIPIGTEVAPQKKVVAITPAAANDALRTLSIGGYVTRTIPPASLQGKALATLIARELGNPRKKKVSIGALQNLYGTDLVRSFTAAWRERGGKVAARVFYEQNLPDYKKQARELVAPKPDAFVFFDFQQTYTRVATELIKTKKWKANRTFASDSLAISTLGQSGGVTVEGLRGVAPSAPRIGPAAEAFQRLWRAEGAPRYQQPFDTQAFDATVLCYLSAVAAGSTKGSNIRKWVRRVSSPPGTKYSWQQLPAAIEALEAGKEIDYQGASGPIDILPLDLTEPGDPTAGFYDAYRFKDARLTVYGTLSVPPGKRRVQPIPIQFITPRVAGVGPPPKPKVGTTGATGASGASGANGKAGKTKKKKSSKNN